MGLVRKLLVPCEEATPDTVLYATDGGISDTIEERGPKPGVPVRGDSNVGGIDARMMRRGSAQVLKALDAEIVCNKSGDIEDARFLWKRTTDPYYRGKGDYTDLSLTQCVRTSTAAFLHHPKLLAMSNGELLIVWAEHASSDGTDTSWLWKSRVMDPRTQLWGPTITIVSPGGTGVSVDRTGGPLDNACIDVAEDPTRPGRIVAIGVGDPTNAATTGDYAIITYFTNDWGRTWKFSAIAKGRTGAGDGPTGIAIEFIGGRLVLVFNNRVDGFEGAYSNDQGTTWVSADISGAPSGKNGGVDIVTTVNGALLAFFGSSGVGVPLQVMWSGDSGATWTSFTDNEIHVANTSTDENGRWPAAIIDDSGYPCVWWYSQTATAKALFFLRAGSRTITLTDVTAATNVFDTNNQELESNVYDDTSATRDPSIIEVAAANWRGRAAIALTYSDTSQRSISISFSGVWNDLRYNTWPATVDGVASWYNWYLPHSMPDTYGTAGYAHTTTGTVTANQLVEGGGLEIVDSGAAADQYTSPALVVDPVVMRCVVRVLQGGSTTADQVCFEVAHATNDTRYRLRLATTGFQLRDVNGAANIGSAVAIDLTKKTEFVFVTTASNTNFVQLYWRTLDALNDGEHQAYSELLGAAVAMGTAAEGTSQYRFGHFTGATAISEWWPIQQQRSQNATSPVSRYDPDDSFQLFDATTSGGTFRTSDRGCHMAEGPMDLCDGLCVGFQGAGALSGDYWAIATRQDFARSLLLEGGPTRPWASNRSELEADTESINVVFDAGVDRKFRADAIALFGCNVPFLTVQLSNADDWVTPPVSIYGYPNSATLGTSFNRNEKIKATSGPVGVLEVASIDGAAVKFVTTATTLRPSQFKPRGTREWFVATIIEESTNAGHVWRIEDNSTDTLYLSAPPLASQMVAGDNLMLYSDRVLVDLGNASGYDRSIGYRFMRLSIAETAFGGVPTTLHIPNEPFFKIGRVILGRLFDIPHPEWGYSRRMIPNVSVIQGAGGQRHATRIGPERESYSFMWPGLPPEVRDTDNWLGLVRSWQRIWDALVSTGLGTQVCALVLEGRGLEQASWLRASGDDLAIVRAVGAIDARHEAYSAVENCGEAEEVLGDFNSVGGIVFEDEV